MFAEERQNMIVALVNGEGSVKVKDLSSRFEVTEDSIRKDLTLLEKKGMLRKTYGGAVKNRLTTHDQAVASRIDKNIEEKKRIASKAMGLIKDGDTVFLDISTTGIELAKMIARSSLNINVVTNMVDILLEFNKPTIPKLIFIGGSFGWGYYDGFVGSLAIERIRNFRFNLAFIGAVGVDLYHNDVTTYVVEDGLTKKVIMDVSKKKYILLENRKFSMDGTYKYARIDDFSGVVLDSEPGDDIKEKCAEYAIDWVY